VPRVRCVRGGRVGGAVSGVGSGRAGVEVGASWEARRLAKHRPVRYVSSFLC
jgi:hypothetical protein